MIKINLIAEKKQTRAKAAPGAAVSADGPSASQNLVLVALFLLGVAVAGGWWWKLSHEIERLQAEVARRLGYRLVDHRLELYAVPLDDKPKR